MIEGKFATVTAKTDFPLGSRIEFTEINYTHDRELHVLHRTTLDLESLKPEQRTRILEYLLSRFPLTPRGI